MNAHYPPFACWLLLLAPIAAQEMPPQSPVPTLVPMLRSADAEVRRTAAEQLGEVSDGVIGLPGVAAVPDLLAVFAGDAESRVAETAAIALAELGTWPLGALDRAGASLGAWSKAGANEALVARTRATLENAAAAWPGGAVVPHLIELLRVPGCVPDVLGVLATLGEDAVGASAAVDALLASEDRAVRWRAAFALFRLGITDTPALRRAMTDRDPAVRFWALRARVAQVPPSPELARHLLPWLDDARRPVREWAFATAGTMGAAAAPLVKALGERVQEPATRSAALRALCGLGVHAAAAVPQLLPLLESEETLVVELLGKIGPGAAVATDALLALATAAPSPPGTPYRGEEHLAFLAITALARIAPDRAIAALLPGVEQVPTSDFPGDWYHVQRFEALGAAAASVLPRLRAMLAGNDVAKARALLAMQPIGERALPALPDVLPLLSSGHEYVRGRALSVIEAIGERAAATALPELERLYATASGNWQTDIIRNLHRFGVAAEPLLVRALAADERWTRAIAIEQLLLLPALSVAARAAVLARLDDDDGVVRERAFASVESAEQVGALLLRTKDPQLRWACVTRLLDAQARKSEILVLRHLWLADPFGTLLGAWNPGDRPASELEVFLDADRIGEWVRSFAAAGEVNRRVAAALAIGRLPSSEEARRTLVGLIADPDATVRQAALLALGQHGRDARPALDAIARARTDADWFVRAAAATALRAVHRG